MPTFYPFTTETAGWQESQVTKLIEELARHNSEVAEGIKETMSDKS